MCFGFVNTLRLLRCIWNIPVCGGFCAPTVNPEDSFLRHFSNEYTIPASGMYMKIGHIIEWSRCCIFTGGLGFSWGAKHRQQVMLAAFMVSFVAFILLLYPMLAVSMNEDMIKWAAWVKGDLHLPNGLAHAEVFVGLRGRVDEVNCKISADRDVCEAAFSHENSFLVPFEPIGDGIYRRTISWSNTSSCARPDAIKRFGILMDLEAFRDFGNHTLMPMCEQCRDSLAETVTFAVMGVITMFPQMTTDLQRSTMFGDVNCQSTMGFATSTFGFFSNLMTLRSFSLYCWRRFPDEVDGANYHWYPGAAFVAVCIASTLKLFDALCHFVVPTPEARRSKPPSEVEELEDWMALALLEEEEALAGSADDSDEQSGSDVGCL